MNEVSGMSIKPAKTSCYISDNVDKLITILNLRDGRSIKKD